MRNFYLMDVGTRLLIDDHIHSGAEVIDECEASSWLTAKAILTDPQRVRAHTKR